MRRLRQVPALLIAMTLSLMLALALGFVPTTRLLAAPPPQASAPAIKGYYQSAVIPGQGDTPGLVVGLVLYDDGSARVVSEYQNDTDVINELGTWVDNGDQTATLTVTGTADAAYAAPVDLDFQVADDGSLVVPGSATSAFGEAGLTLVPTPFGNSDAILAQIPGDALAYQSNVIAWPTSIGLQLTLALFEDGSLTLVSDYMKEGEIVVEIGKWTQGDDSTLNVSLTGQIEDGNGKVTEYDAPLEFVFSVNDDNSLDLVDEGGALFGPAGVTLVPITATGAVTSDETAESVAAGEAAAGVAPEASEVVTDEVSSVPTEEATEEAAAAATPEATETPEASTEAITETVSETATEPSGATEESISETNGITLSGAYVSALLPTEGEGGNFLVMIFNDDGSLYFTTYSLNGDRPLVEVGTWSANEEGGFTATVTGTVEKDYDAPIDVSFTVGDDGVINIADVNLYPLANIDLANAPTLVAEFQSDPITYTVDPTHTLTLAFYDDSSAELTTAYEEGEPAIQYGDWAVNEAGDAITVTLTRDDSGDLDQPEEMIFAIGDNETLTLSNDEAGYYGDEGLTLTAADIEDEGALEEDTGTEPVAESSEPVAEENGSIESSEEVTSTEELSGTEGLSGTEEITSTDEVSSTEETTSEASIQIFQSEVLPSPSSPGLQLTLGMQDDGSAAIDYDYMNQEDVVTNTGKWVLNDDGTLTVTLTDGPNGKLDLPVELTLSVNDDGNWVITDASEESLGLVDVVLTPVAAEQ